MTNKLSIKMKATILLRKYDHLRKELRETEHELGKAVAAYGREIGLWGLNKDHFRSEIERDELVRLEIEAERNAWETANT
jgi:hypothetical protein